MGVRNLLPSREKMVDRALAKVVEAELQGDQPDGLEAVATVAPAKVEAAVIQADRTEKHIARKEKPHRPVGGKKDLTPAELAQRAHAKARLLERRAGTNARLAVIGKELESPDYVLDERDPTKAELREKKYFNERIKRKKIDTRVHDRIVAASAKRAGNWTDAVTPDATVNEDERDQNDSKKGRG